MNFVKNYYKFLIFFTFTLCLFSLYCALTIGLGVDENYHHKNGALRYLYLTSLGKFDAYNWANTKFYPGLYDTIHYTLAMLIDKLIDIKHVIKIKHFINYSFSSLGILGLFFVNKKIFNKEIAILSCILTLLNPVFFGHMGTNPKDPIIFTALIWTIYFFINYIENLDKPHLKYLILMSVFIGFGTGIRLTFIALLLPLAIIWIYLVFKKKVTYSSVLKDLFFGFTIIASLTIITWPHIHNGNYELIFEVIKKSSTWLIPMKHGVINGNFYEIQNTPRTYIFEIFLYRIPLYFSILIIFSYVVIFLQKIFFIEKVNSNYIYIFYLLNLVLFFPLTTMIITKTNIYDNARLILFTMPFFATIASLGLFFILVKFREINYIYKSFSFIILFLFILSIYRFIALTPYQYTYTNYLSSPVFSKAQNKFEHDYWYTSYGELFKKIKEKYGDVEASKLKIRTCDNHHFAYRYYFNQILKTNQSEAENAEYVILTDRNLRFRKMNCLQLFEGDDIVSVKRLGLTLSALRKINTKEARDYMTQEWLNNN
tara:strand:+ start:496 stop:2118 length:1623 start_codon:yes stop_codon:yes gene_type:complete